MDTNEQKVTITDRSHDLSNNICRLINYVTDTKIFEIERTYTYVENNDEKKEEKDFTCTKFTEFLEHIENKK